MAELIVRTGSAIVMIAIAGAALWTGGWWFAGFALIVAIGVLWEWWRLSCAITGNAVYRLLWLVAGLIYIGVALSILVTLRFVVDANHIGLIASAAIVGITIVIDVCAFGAGRLLGGPKIAPSISPSKTWAGLIGAIVGAAGILIASTVGSEIAGDVPVDVTSIAAPAAAGAVLAVVSQAGDFFESWMKRRAGVKDSGNLIPGHGGLFDRLDGLIPVSIVAGSGLLALLAYARGMW